MSPNENGGAGTVYVNAISETSLFIDNQGNRPENPYVIDPEHNSGKTYIVNHEDYDIDEYDFKHVTIVGAGHLIFLDLTDKRAPVNIDNLHGDRTGFLHSSDQQISIINSDSPFPSSFRMYENHYMALPESKFFLNIIILLYII